MSGSDSASALLDLVLLIREALKQRKALALSRVPDISTCTLEHVIKLNPSKVQDLPRMKAELSKFLDLVILRAVKHFDQASLNRAQMIMQQFKHEILQQTLHLWCQKISPSFWPLYPEPVPLQLPPYQPQSRILPKVDIFTHRSDSAQQDWSTNRSVSARPDKHTSRSVSARPDTRTNRSVSARPDNRTSRSVSARPDTRTNRSVSARPDNRTSRSVSAPGSEIANTNSLPADRQPGAMSPPSTITSHLGTTGMGSGSGSDSGVASVIQHVNTSPANVHHDGQIQETTARSDSASGSQLGGQVNSSPATRQPGAMAPPSTITSQMGSTGESDTYNTGSDSVTLDQSLNK